MNTDALFLLKILIGMGIIVFILCLSFSIIMDFSDNLLSALKTKYVTQGKEDFGSDTDLEINQRNINFYIKSIQIKVILIIICVATMFMLCWEGK